MNIEVPSQKELIDFYGKEDRTTVVMEELAELAKAVSKYKRYVLNEDKYKNDKRYDETEIVNNMKEEIADVLICIRIMQDIVGINDSEIEEEVQRKNDDNRLCVLWRHYVQEIRCSCERDIGHKIGEEE